MLVTFMKINYTLFQEINAPAGTHPWLDSVMIFCANSLIFLFPLVLVMTWGRPLNWRKYLIYQEEEKLLQERRAVVLWTGIACLVAYGINLLIEQFVFEPRPFISHHVHLLISHVADSSFPSDHTAWACAVVGMLLFSLFPQVYRQQGKVRSRIHTPPLLVPLFLLGLALLLAISIGIARIYCWSTLPRRYPWWRNRWFSCSTVRDIASYMVPSTHECNSSLRTAVANSIVRDE